jgi:hypothetical protein
MRCPDSTKHPALENAQARQLLCAMPSGGRRGTVQTHDLCAARTRSSVHRGNTLRVESSRVVYDEILVARRGDGERGHRVIIRVISHNRLEEGNRDDRWLQSCWGREEANSA